MRELKRKNLREKELKRGRSEEPCPVGACLVLKSFELDIVVP